ncbi:PcfB family protein, partial [uncultured Eubacterium sp.]
MADEISQAIQIIRLEFDGLRFGMNVTGATAKQVKNLTIFLYALLTREKLQGRTSLKKMISKDGNLQVLKIKETDYKKFSKVAKKYGLLYSKLPDINKDDGMMEILFHTEATPRINALIEKLGSGSIEDLVDYVKNGKDGDFEKITDYLQQNNVLRSDKSITPSEEKKSQINSISRNLDYNAKLKDDCLVDVTVAKKLYIEENLTQLKMRIPNTYGAGARYVWIDKDDAIPIND